MTLLHRLRDSFLFVPLLIVGLAAILAQASVYLSGLWQYDDMLWVPTAWFEIGSEGARGLFSAIASSTLTAATTAFSITVSVIATASTSFGPRLVRNFMNDLVNQVVLGILLGTFVFSLLALRTVKSPADGEESFVPHVAVNMALVLALLNVIVIIYFIFHISDSIQLESLAGRTKREFLTSIDILRKEQDGAGTQGSVAYGVLPDPPEDAAWVTARTSGYLASANLDDLRKAAAPRGRIWLLPRVGDYVVRGERVMAVSDAPNADLDKLAKELAIRSARSPYRDVRFAQIEVLDLAVRGLSNGTNDPYTAVTAIDELSEGMCLLVSGPHPHLIADTVIHRPVSLKELVDQLFDHLRPYITGDPLSLIALLHLARRMGEACIHPELTASIRAHVALLVEEAETQGHSSRDLTLVHEAAREAYGGLLSL